MFSLNGFSDAITIKTIDDGDIGKIEHFMREELPKILAEKSTIEVVDYKQYYGEVFDSTPHLFRFVIGDKKLLHIIVGYVNNAIDTSGIEYFVGDKLLSKNPVQHTLFLNKLVETADRNYGREKHGYRFDWDIKYFASYIRMLAGPLCYETLQKNLVGSLPSLSSTNVYIQKSKHQYIEGELRAKELLAYLKELNLPLVVSISEDATRIENRLQYDSSTNQIIGFVLPINQETGMPIPYSYMARNAEEMISHFAQNQPIASLVNVVMAQPISETFAPPFCLLLFGSDNKYTQRDVCNRWKFIAEQLSELNIKVLTVSSDSDPKFNSSMRYLSKLGQKSDVFPDTEWFSCVFANYQNNFLLFVQDIIHIATKLRNFFLKTIMNPELLPFGDFFIQQSHLEYLLQNFSKDKHCLTHSTLNPIDKQNFESVQRMYDQKVIDLLRSSVHNSIGTIKFLEIMRDIVNAYRSINLKPLERIHKMWHALFLIRIWREYIVTSESFTLKKNFLTTNCYSCIELNAHTIILCMLYLKAEKLDHLFQPFLFDSQPCESLFRQARSFTSTYSTVANCSVKEIIGRISKIHFQNQITHLNTTNYVFPKRLKSEKKTYETYELPAQQEIIEEVERAKKFAIQDALKLGLINADDIEGFDFSCQINPIEEMSKPRKTNFNMPSNNAQQVFKKSLQLKSIMLKNYDGKLIHEKSPFVEICYNSKKKFVVKKTSFCWMLRKDSLKLSSDRLLRVQMSDKRKTRKAKRCLLYNKPKRTSKKCKK